MQLDELTVESLAITDGDGPKVQIQAYGDMVGIWMNDGSSDPSLGIVMQKGKPPYLAFYTSDREHYPAAISIDQETGQLYFQEAQK